MAWLQQLYICLRKDLIIAKRNWRSTVISIFVPVFFVMFLVVLQVAFNNNQRLSDVVKPVRTSSVIAIPEIPRCFVGHTPVWSSCITVAFAPQTDPIVVDIIDQIKAKNRLTYSDVMGFDTSSDLDRYLLSHPNLTQAAYNFFVVRDAGAVVGVRYAVQYNTSTSSFRGVEYDTGQHVLIPMQKAADIGIMSTLITDRVLDVDYDYIPFPHPETAPLDVAAEYGPSFFFGALMFNFVIQLGRLVTEKEMSLRASMKLMGLRDSVYNTAAFVIVLGYNCISSLSLSLAGLAFQLNFFVKNDFGLYFLLFLLFGLAMTPLVLLLAVFVSRSRTATVLGFGVFLVGTIIQGFAQFVFVESTALYYRLPFSFLPFALLAKGMMDLSSFSNTADSVGLRWSSRTSSSAFYSMDVLYGWFMIDMVTFLTLAIYLDQVVPNDNGVSQPPQFFLLPSYWLPSRARPVALAKVDLDAEQYHDVDEDVRREMREAVDEQSTAPFRVVNFQKTFWGYKFPFRRDPSKDFHAVRGVFLTIPHNTLFCLLGHNGAGKTTTINALTGLTLATEGDAYINGKSIRTNMSDVQKSMGVCPQYDILWGQMTAREHLELFAGLKQLEPDQVGREVSARLEDVDLTEDADNLAGNFSGGMQRRLSVAIALIGDPELVYLDEPTTGMDPVSRRKVWDLIERVKHNRITVLTTHSMEEADVLSDKIAIMHQGRFAVMGNALRLKQRFGSGYHITIRNDEPFNPAIKEFMTTQIPGCSLEAVEEGGQRFILPRESTDGLGDLFHALETRSTELGVDNIQLSLSSLEDVFLKVGGLGEVDERIGEQEDDEAVVDNGITAMLRRNKIKSVLAFLFLIIIIAIIISASSSEKTDVVADLMIYDGNVKYGDLTTSLWSQIRPGGATMCSRGDDFFFFVKPGPTSLSNLIVEFQGGGICWDAITCAATFGSSNFNASISDDFIDDLKFGRLQGIFEQTDRNPFKDWTHVYIPLCTADAFLGNATGLYDAGLEVRHLGAINAAASLDWIYRAALTPSKVLITGWQHGATGATFHAPGITAQFPNAASLLLLDNEFDISNADSVGNGTLSGFTAAPMLAIAMEEWRAKAFSSWAVSSSSIPSILRSSTSNPAEWSSERIILTLANTSSPSAPSIARLSSNLNPSLTSFIITVLSSSPTVATVLGAMNIDARTFFASSGDSGGSEPIAALACSVLKSLHDNLTAVATNSTGRYAGFLSNATTPAFINFDLLYSAEGTTSSGTVTTLGVWVAALVTSSFGGDVFGTACPSE